MSGDRVQRKPYESRRRATAARENRGRIRSAASELFTQRGFNATTMTAVARAAAVSERTVYLAYRTKAALLNECIRVAIRGDDDRAPLQARAAWQAALNSPPDEMLARFADGAAQLMTRAARLLAVGESVDLADPQLRKLRERGRAATRADMLDAAKALKRAGVLRTGLPPARAADIIYAIASSESVFLRLVEHRGWSPADYAKVIEHALTGALT